MINCIKNNLALILEQSIGSNTYNGAKIRVYYRDTTTLYLAFYYEIRSLHLTDDYSR